jgi:hypothetical protein
MLQMEYFPLWPSCNHWSWWDLLCRLQGGDACLDRREAPLKGLQGFCHQHPHIKARVDHAESPRLLSCSLCSSFPTVQSGVGQWTKGGTGVRFLTLRWK